MALDLFAACLPGLEPLLADELRALGAAPEEQPGGAAFAGDAALLRRAHLWLGTASHLLLRCGTFRCRNLGELTTKTASLPWREWLRPDAPVAVRATAQRSRLYHTGAIAERVQKGIDAALGRATEPETTEAPVQLAARVRDDVVTLSIDTAAEPLHRRGYRLDGGKAPLREDLAHALLRAAGFAPGTPLLDPFCGSGTIAIEAATLAAGLPPGRLRPAPLRGTALQDDDAWRQLVAAASQPPVSLPPAAPIAASDRDAGAVAAAEANAERAGVRALLDVRCCALTAAPWLAAPADAPPGLLLATNPPFGRRIGPGSDLAPLYQSLGHRFASLPGARMALLAHDPRLARRTGCALRVCWSTRHGGLSVAALVSGPPA
ncbi:MAG: class I SAM-dependent RNA methyltransferase [Planctomycetota bacterium]